MIKSFVLHLVTTDIEYIDPVTADVKSLKGMCIAKWLWQLGTGQAN